jgi:catechol 2,3-dioxygenase-like lactoylglutathione lyase family enzyme
MTLTAITLETPDPPALAAFYRDLLGRTVGDDGPTDDVRVCLDPDGHPFCLYIPE